MKNIYKIVLILTPLLFMGCNDSNSNPTETQAQSDVPKSPSITDKEKVPPSIPLI